MELPPVIGREFNHCKSRGRHPLIEPLARLDIAGGDQQPRGFVQPGVVPDHQQRAGRPIRLLDDLKNELGTCIVEAVVIADRGRSRERSRQAFPSLAGAPSVRDDGAVRHQRMMGEVGADFGGILAAAGIERALGIACAGRSLFGLGVSKQQQAHGDSVDFSRAAV